jgi:hypothetical protein
MEKKAIKSAVTLFVIALLLLYGGYELVCYHDYVLAVVNALVSYGIGHVALSGYSIDNLRRKRFLEELSRSEHFERLAKVDQMLLRDLIENNNH